ncbi:MAG: hypothetical protein JKY54_17130 [Flavobacteriales bacterium]|nr:hypothetical protein [Flavobacteriales bacterium]
MQDVNRELTLDEVLSEWFEDGKPEIAENIEVQIELPNGNRLLAILNPNNPGYYQIGSPDNDRLVNFKEPARWRYITTKINKN